MVKAELSPIGLPIKDQELMLKTAEVLKKNIRFEWKGPQEWVGLSKKDLIELTIQIATFIGITPEQAQMLNIVFGDHHPSFRGHHTESAVCVPYSSQGVISRIDVVANRSLEVVEEVMKRNKTLHQTEKTQFENNGLRSDGFGDIKDYVCTLAPVEAVVWMIAEELKHAHIFLVAGSTSRYDAWERRYLEMLKTRESHLGDVYDIDFNEVTACRLVLRILTYFSTEKVRQTYFRNWYLESLTTNRVIFGAHEKGTYIPTGYNTTPFSRLVEMVRRYL